MECHLDDSKGYLKECQMVSLKDSRKEYSMVYLTEVSLASRKVHLLKWENTKIEVSKVERIENAHHYTNV